MDEHRILRVSETVREELSEIVAFEMSDPRLVVVDVREVHLSPDSRHAHIGVSLSGDKKEQEQGLAALEHAKNYLRHELARRLNLRRMPELHFTADLWSEAENRVEILLKRARKKRGSLENQS